jgi:transglutaminase-like putative cysteine protease/predicted glutamine amidotransferase
VSEIFGASFDILSSPILKLNKKQKLSVEEKSPWGIAWYPYDQVSASVVRDVTNSTAKNFSRLLSSWDNFCSTFFLFRLEGQKEIHTQHNTQPFHRSYGGRDWVLSHRGSLNKNELKKLLPVHAGIFEPLGITDSEITFCHLLSKFHDEKINKISDIDPKILNIWFKTINSYGTADLILSDGQSVALYCDANTTDNIYYKRYMPPHNGELFVSELINFSIDTDTDSNRTGVIFSTTKPIDLTGWATLQSGQMIIVRRGSIVWDSNNCDLTTENYYPENIQSQSPIQNQLSGQVVEQFTAQQKSGFTEGASIKPIILNVKATTTADGKSLQYKTYSIVHDTKYIYDSPIEKSSHILRLQPIDDQVQELIQTTLELSADCEKAIFEDVFGNPSISLNIEKPYTEFSIRSTSIVKIYQSPKDDLSISARRISIPLVWMPWQRQMMSPYLLPPELPESQLQELSEFAMSFIKRNDYNLHSTLEDMNSQLHKDFKYVSGSTTLETTPYDVFVSRNGVCQDFANLFICLCRLLSIPARYRVGYIYTGGNYANQEQGDATHAWAEVYLPYIGWRGFDPTNGTRVKQDHIRLGCGRHFRDATPTSGTIYSKSKHESLQVTVKVTELNL